jgi:hypothetical protein
MREMRSETRDGTFPMRGVGPFAHTDPPDRPADVLGGIDSLHFAPERAPACCCR